MSTSHSHLSTETHVFLDSLSVCWTRFSEDSLLYEEQLKLKSKFQDKNIEIPLSELKQCLIRSIFLEMLGYEATFIYIHAINMTQSSIYSHKKLGYLACCLFLNESSELLILLISTIQKDLQSNKPEIVKLALSTTSKFLCPEFIENTHILINSLLKHENREIKVKALMVLYQMYKYSPSLIGPFEKTLKSFLNDVHLKTLGMISNILCEEARKRPDLYQDVLDNVIQLLTSLFLKKFKEDQGFYTIKSKILDSKTFVEVPPPWMQIKLLQIIASLVGENQKNSEKCSQILHEIVKEYSSVNSNATDAVLFECMRTIFNIYPNKNLIEKCCDILSFYLNQKNEQKYMGIKTLLCLSDQNLRFVNQYQEEIMACLENNDFMIKRKTLLLLAKIANFENIGIVLPKLLKYLQMETDEFFKKLLISRIFELFKKFTPDPNFFLLFGTEFLKFGGNAIGDFMKNDFIRMIYAIYLLDKSKMGSIIANFFIDMINYEQNLPENLLQISSWILGEIGSEKFKDDKKKLISMIVALKEKILVNFYEKNTLSWVLGALMKINSQTNYDLAYFLKSFHLSKDIDLTQRLKEFDLTTKHCFIKDSQSLLDIDENLSFLDVYVDKYKKLGYKLYDPQRNIKDKTNINEDSTAKTTTNSNNDDDETKIHYQGKKFWGNQTPSKIDSEKKLSRSQQNRNSLSSISRPEIAVEQEKKPEEIKPISLFQTPNEEFASKVFKGILDESRKREHKLFGISHPNNKITTKIQRELDEDMMKFNVSSQQEENNIAGNLNDYILRQDIEKIENLFQSLNENEEKIVESENLGKEEIKRLADNFSLRIFEKNSKELENKFIIAGIKSNEAIVCLAEENFARLQLKFRSSSKEVVSHLIGFVKEYINKKGFKIY